MKILVIQGPNLNILGHRAPHIYGNVTLDQIHTNLQAQAKQHNADIEFFQSNFEGEIIDKLQKYLDSIPMEERPHILQTGHIHQAFYMKQGKTHCFQTSCLEDQTELLHKSLNDIIN